MRRQYIGSPLISNAHLKCSFEVASVAASCEEAEEGWYTSLIHYLPGRSEVKERMKKAKADKASAKAADVKKAGGKATKNASRGGKVVGGKR